MFDDKKKTPDSSITDHQWLAMMNFPLELKPTEQGHSWRYHSETTDTTFAEGTIRILVQRGHVRMERGNAVLTDRGQEQVDLKLSK